MASSPSVFLEAPSKALFNFPPPSDPQAIPPPHFDLPFTIPDGVFQAALDPRVPITIAAVYAISAKLLNKYNKSTGKKPWGISKTKPFHVFVVLHNVFLAVYSAWTFVGMLKALQKSIVSPAGPNGLAGTVDSFCKLNGPAGFGNAAIYIQEQNGWETSPSRVDAGRLWNEGLAFYGWIFYLSKFYEVLDTFIILAKGKFSSTLQTYHHAGAMMCMWAGMRYMSGPIWMFVFVNSGIHAMMYTYFTITAFSIKVPTAIKRTLTTLQITQFLIGASYAMVHSFVYYTVPVQVPISKPAAAASSVAAATTRAAGAGGFLDSLTQVVFGAAEAANAGAVVAPRGQADAADAIEYKTQYEAIPCITSTGQTFAIWINVLYLLPLTYLFGSFFVASYLRRSNAEADRQRVEKKSGGGDRRLSNAMIAAEKAGWDAARHLEKEVYGQQNESAILEEDESVAINGNSRALRTRVNGAKANGKKHPQLAQVAANGRSNE
ncbi:GNS1/SUR4 family-domain-containing protein [Xylariales sp. AK1849]|nr:GNS1/SUR4 family-domain-containing protein [Xylariales sp. AK1849]